MAFEMGQGLPVISGGNDSFLGSGGIGALLIGALLFGGGLGGFGRNAAGVVEGANAGAISGMQTQLSAIQSQLNTGTVTGELNAQSAEMNANARLLSSQISGLSTDVATGNFTTLSSINGLGRDVSAQAYQAALQNLNSFNLLNTNLLQGFNTAMLQNTTAFNGIQTSLCGLSREMAECCCAIKGEIHADGEATRALINNLNVQSLQTQLADAKSALNNANQTNYIQSALNQQSATIITHLSDKKA